jgi:hypothetical protein
VLSGFAPVSPRREPSEISTFDIWGYHNQEAGAISGKIKGEKLWFEGEIQLAYTWRQH